MVRGFPIREGLTAFLSLSQNMSPAIHATDYCRQALVQNSSCCLDTGLTARVTQERQYRPGTSWKCLASAGCYSEEGQRGEDVLSIPRGAACDSCRILFLHGGSWYTGSPNTTGYGVLASRLAQKTGCIVMMPDFPLLPVGNYSSILQGSVKAFQWLGSHAILPTCPSSFSAVNILIGGDSSGGTTAMSLLLHLQKHPELLPQHVFLAGGFFWSPWTNLMCNTPEYVSNAYSQVRDPNLNTSIHLGDIIFKDSPEKSGKVFREVALEYVGGQERLLQDPIASPFYATAEFLLGLPALYFLVGSEEALLGDSTILAKKAAAYGVQVVVDIFHGMWHDFPMYSEGCGSGNDLWLGLQGINHTADFVLSQVGAATNLQSAFRGNPLIRYIYDESISGRKAWFAAAEARPNQPHIQGNASAHVWSTWCFVVGMLIGALLGCISLLFLQTARKGQQGNLAAPSQVELTRMSFQ